MIPKKKKRDLFKQWLSSFFPSKDETVPFTPNGPQRDSGPVPFFNNPTGFAIHNSTMTAVHGNQYNTTYVQGDRNIVPQIMSLISQHIIHGAAHDDSARDPPPRCHPDTRVKLIARITAWFDGKVQEELLLWITGPAGVGKSAIVQTFAEYLVKSKSLGASVFISRPNKRNKPQGIFITIAFQLATRIEQYRNFVVERLSLDPSLLTKGMAAQFMTFIVEPFVDKKIGVGCKRWGILLDGLDELQGEDAQCEIIQLISAFVHEHRDVPLVWVIASRPESHISNTFDDDEIRRSCWTEYIPIDSTEACEDVERFLRAGFKTTQKKFRHTVHSDWPSDTDFLKLTAAASGLFIYAQVVMQFIGDPDHGDPVSRFELLLAVIDRSNAVPTEENPFVHLDALYTEIISLIPSALWPNTKRLLALRLHAEGARISELRFSSTTLRGMSILLGMPRHVIYACLNKCRSTIKIPDWKVGHKQNLTFLHASFADYLKDSQRSGELNVGNADEVWEDVSSSLLEIWNKCSGGNILAASVESMWLQYCSQLDDKPPSRAVAKFHAKLFQGTVRFARVTMRSSWNTPVESPRYTELRKVHMIKLCHCLDADGVMNFVLDLIGYSSNFHDRDMFRQVELRNLQFGHIDWKEMSPSRAHFGRSGKFSKEEDWILHRPGSSAELKAFVSELETLQESSPKLDVFVVGGTPQGRVAIFQRHLPPEHSLDSQYFMYYVVPYPE